MPIDEPDDLEVDVSDFLPEDDDDFDDATEAEDFLPEDDDEDLADDGDEHPAEDRRAADHEAALIARARKRGGTVGAIVAGGMLGLEKMLGQKVKEEAPVEWEAPGEPLDIDRNGITVPLEDDAVARSQPRPTGADGSADRSVTRRRRP